MYLTKQYPQIHTCNRRNGKRYDHITGKYTYLIAINLFNNEEILPAMMHNLIKLIDQYFLKNVYLRIYESGSTDKTKEILAEFYYLLKDRGIDFEIETSPIIKNTRDDNRIDYLVHIRNYALEPLLKKRIKVDHVLFFNDIFFCYDDVLELIHQQHLNNAFLTGGMDYTIAPWEAFLFYDSWVTQDIDGRHPADWEVGQQIPVMNPEDKERHSKLLPIQMMCLWNGMVSLNATIFENSNFTFRRGLNQNKNDDVPGECAASEITTFCLDMIKNGFGKLLMVPQVKVAYTTKAYNLLKFEDNFFTKKYPLNAPHSPEEDIPIEWKPFGKTQDCWPYLTGFRGRENINRGNYEETIPVPKINNVY